MSEEPRRPRFRRGLPSYALLPGVVLPMAPWDVVVDPIRDLIDTINTAIDFIQDPALWVLIRLQEACSGMMSVLMKGVVIAAEPDLSAQWFLDVYKINFTLSALMLIPILGWQFIQLSRRQISGDELMESLVYFAPTYFLGAMFGPGVGALLVKLFGVLTTEVIQLVLGRSAEDMTTQLNELITMDNAVAVAGGIFVAIFVMFMMMIGLFIALVIVIIQMVTLYFSGVAVPLGLVWMVSPKNRGRAWKLPTIWLGMLAAHPLLVIMLGFAMLMAVNLSLDPGHEALEILVNLIAVTIALFMAGLSPAVLLKFVVSAAPGVSASGPQVGLPQRGGGPSNSPSTTDLTKDQAQSSDGESVNSVDTPGDPVGGGGVGRLESAGEDDEGMMSAGADDDPTDATPDVGGSAKDKARSAAGPGGSEGGPGGVESLASDGASGAAEAGEAAEAAEGAEAAGAASSATGVGAVVGVPLIVGAEAMKVGAKIADLAQQGAEYAQEPMEGMDNADV